MRTYSKKWDIDGLFKEYQALLKNSQQVSNALYKEIAFEYAELLGDCIRGTYKQKEEKGE